MPDGLLLFVALLAVLLGMGWFALAMEPHWRQVFGDAARTPATRVRLCVLGTLALATSLVLCIRVDHPSMAVLVWVMALAAATLIIAFTLSWRARWLRVLLLRG